MILARRGEEDADMVGGEIEVARFRESLIAGSKLLAFIGRDYSRIVIVIARSLAAGIGI